MKLILAFFLLYSAVPSWSKPRQPWLGTWKIKQLICPFECSQSMKDFFARAKEKSFEFTEEKIVDPSGMGTECDAASKPDYSGLKTVTLVKYLGEWSENEQANLKPNIKRTLPAKLGLKPKTKVVAGLINCAHGTQNMIFVHSRQAFARYEENAYWELSR